LDIRWGYNNIRIKEGDEWKAAFITRRGLFEPTVMFFGLCNSPATFQKMMDEIFHDLIREKKIIIYIDDILIFHGTSLNEHKAVVHEVMVRLVANKLYLKAEKCTFNQSEVEYLGTICGNGKFRMDPGKIKAVLEWPIPKTVKNVQEFLGFTNFYRRFIKAYAEVARILSHLTGKDKWEWGTEQLKAFNTLRLAFQTEPILYMVIARGKFRIEVDSSGFANGGVLLQWQKGEWRTIAFRSGVLLAAERNYSVEDRELLAIMAAIKDWRRYLLYTDEPFEIWTDHANLQYFKQPQKISRRQARWLTVLAEYHFTLHHFPGKRIPERTHCQDAPIITRGRMIIKT
jgi:hypothetical protein